MMGERFLAPVARGQSAVTLDKFSFACQRELYKHPAISTRWIHESGGCSPFQTPKEVEKS